ncbi:MAG: hypothetical protein ACFFF9_07025 [Candidatus Thorarchaeota archaeon]
MSETSWIKEIDFSRIHFSLAGCGDPWSSLTKFRVQLMKGLSDGAGPKTLAKVLDISYDSVMAELRPLRDVSLVIESDGELRPSFLMTDESETVLVYDHASDFSAKLADTLENHIAEIKQSYQELDVSKLWGFESLAFLMVGGRIIDIKLLENLAFGTCLMPPAPARPSPDRPDAHYYFWMVEGEKKHMGEYGLNDYDLPWLPWRYFSFAQNFINGTPNIGREEMDTRCFDIIDEGSVNGPDHLGKELGIPVVSMSDSVRFAQTSEKYASLLSANYVKHEHSIKSLHKSLKSGQYAPHSYGEFFCWYAHIAYSVAIDTLESRGILPIPPERFQSAIWYREQDREGLLFGT